MEKDQAEKIISEIKSRINEWKTVADKYGISKREQTMMEKVFKV